MTTSIQQGVFTHGLTNNAKTDAYVQKLILSQMKLIGLELKTLDIMITYNITMFFNELSAYDCKNMTTCNNYKHIIK